MSLPKTSPDPLAASYAAELIDWTAELAAHAGGLRVVVESKLSGEASAAVDDVLQDVAMAVHRSELRPSDPAVAGAWLRSIARHKAQDYWRKIERQRRLESDLVNQPELLVETKSPYEWVLEAESRDGVCSALSELSGEDRELLRGKYFQDQNYDQLAAERGLSVKALEYRLTRARSALRRKLERHHER